MKNFAFTLGLLVFCFFNLHSQVYNRYLSEGETLIDFIGFPLDRDAITLSQEDINFDAVLQKDEILGKEKNRFAVKTLTDYTVEDGHFMDYGLFSTWTATFSASKRVSSLNFLFEDTFLPESAQMFIYSEGKDFLHGPITQKNIFDKTYPTDIIEGSDVGIIITVLTSELEQLEFNPHYSRQSREL